MIPSERDELHTLYVSMTEQQLHRLRRAFVQDKEKGADYGPCVRFATSRIHAIDDELARRKRVTNHRKAQEQEAANGSR